MFGSQGKISKKVAFSAGIRQSPGNFLPEKWHFLPDSAGGRFCKMVFGRVSGLCQKSTLSIFLCIFEKCPGRLLSLGNGHCRRVEGPDTQLLSAGRSRHMRLCQNYLKSLVKKRAIFSRFTLFPESENSGRNPGRIWQKFRQDCATFPAENATFFRQRFPDSAKNRPLFKICLR